MLFARAGSGSLAPGDKFDGDGTGATAGMAEGEGSVIVVDGEPREASVGVSELVLSARADDDKSEAPDESAWAPAILLELVVAASAASKPRSDDDPDDLERSCGGLVGKTRIRVGASVVGAEESEYDLKSKPETRCLSSPTASSSSTRVVPNTLTASAAAPWLVLGAVPSSLTPASPSFGAGGEVAAAIA